MKYIIIPIIALGFTLCSLFGIEYKCEGQEMFPDFYGSPFIFMRENLGSSLEYYYSISGLVLDVIVWSIPLYCIHHLIEKVIERTSNKKLTRVFYYAIVDTLVFFSCLNLYMAHITLAKGFDEYSNYWYWDVSQEANNWGMTCVGEWKFIRFH